MLLLCPDIGCISELGIHGGPFPEWPKKGEGGKRGANKSLHY